VALHPGAVDPRRRWPVERFAAVGDALAEAGARILLSGSGGERTLADAIAAHMRHPVLPLCGALSLRGLVGVLERCTLLVSNDTGPRHLAEAVDTATVSVYWCGNLINVGPLTRLRHRAHVSWRLDCPVCGATGMGDALPRPERRPRLPAPGVVRHRCPGRGVLTDALDLYHDESCPGGGAWSRSVG